MTRLLLIVTLVGLALAKPETYREKEDFQYQRSSSDEGTKSGFYGAQRGNMGGNYERAHNMDTVAQKQMSSAVNQVAGEIGDVSDTNTGSVFTAANTRGVYGQGQYDLSNLQGRNFQESSTFDSNSRASALHSGFGSHSSLDSAAYSGGHSAFSAHNAKYSGYHADAETLHRNNLQALDDLSNGHEYGRKSGYGSEYHGYTGSQTNAYDQQHSNIYASNRQYATKNRLVGANGAPVKIIIRPGSTVDVPVAAETFEDRQTSAASSHDTVNRDVEVLTNPDRDHVVVRPVGAAKHYESSFKYHKEWEKHDTKPVSIPLSIPTIPQNKELYDDSQSLSGTEFQGNSIASSGYRVAANSQAHSKYNAQRQGASYGTRNYAYPVPYTNEDAVVGVGSANPAPKKYESSYSYHKSWERQGDPYVIQPVQAVPVESQRLTAPTKQAYGSHQYGSQYKSSHQSYTKSGALIDCDCDDETNSRVVRSVDSVNQRNHDYNPYLQNYEQEDLTQQVQNEDLKNLRSHHYSSGSERLEDFGQQQNQWDKNNRFERVEDLGQQTQDSWGNFESVKPGESLKHFQVTNEHVKPVWEQSEDDSQHTLVHAVDSTDNGPFFKPTMGELEFPMHSPEIRTTPNEYNMHTHSMHEEKNFESQQNDNSEDFMHEHKTEKQNKDQSPIQNLWDRIDGLQQTLSSNRDGMEYDQQSHWHGYEHENHDYTSQSSMQNWHSGSGDMQNSQHNQNHFRWEYPARIPSEVLLPPATVKDSDVSSTSVGPFVINDDKNPKHIGRGDIDDDNDSTNDAKPSQNKPTSQIYTNTQQTKPNKSPKEIEALSLTKENDNTANKFNYGIPKDTEPEIANTNGDLGVLSLSEQWLDELKKNISEMEKNNNTADSKLTSHSDTQSTHQVDQETYNYDKLSNNYPPDSQTSQHSKQKTTLDKDENKNTSYTYYGSFDQQNTGDQEFLDMVQEAISQDQQSELAAFDQHSSRQFENLGQEIVNLHSPSESLEPFDSHSLHSQQHEYFGQETVNSDPPREPLGTSINFQTRHHESKNDKIPSDSLTSFDTQNKDSHNPVNLEQETVNLYEPGEFYTSSHNLNSQQHGYYGQRSENFEIPSDASSSNGEHNMPQIPMNHGVSHQTVHLNAPSESLNTFDTQSSQKHKKLDQQSENFGGFEQHSTGQETEDLGQHSLDLQQQDKLDSLNKYLQNPSDKSKDLEQSADDTQNPTSFDARSSLQQPQGDNFYKNRYVALNSESSPNVAEDQAEKQKPEEVVATVTEVTTEKPGFWKSVGSKFVSAKDKVSSWFKSS